MQPTPLTPQPGGEDRPGSEVKPQPEGAAGPAPAAFPESRGPSRAYYPRPVLGESRSRGRRAWVLLGLAAALAAGAAGYWAVSKRGQPPQQPGISATAPVVDLAIPVPAQAQEALELTISGSQGSHEGEVEVLVRGSLFRRLSLDSRGTLVRIPLAYSGEPVLVQIRAIAQGGESLPVRVTSARPLYTPVLFNSWAMPYQIWEMTDDSRALGRGEYRVYSNSLELINQHLPLTAR